MRTEFLNNPQVVEFAGWLARRLPGIRLHLDVPHSTFVPGGLKADTTFRELVPAHYRWRIGGMSIGDWQETLQRMRALAMPLRRAVLQNDVQATCKACKDIADWGADRNARVGAAAFVESLGDDLPAYLKRVGSAMRLVTPDPTGRFRAVPRMNSTLCNIHALYALDGLPIYESRVGAAIGVLVETWRRDTGRDEGPLPPALRFPAVGNQAHRRVRWVFPEALEPGTLAYANSSEIATAGRWAGAAVRLGLLMEATLARSDPLFCVAWPSNPASRQLTARMAAFTASLFVAGYNPRSLDVTGDALGQPGQAMAIG